MTTVTDRELAVEVLAAMGQDCGPVCAEPYAGWAKQLAGSVVALSENGKL